MRGVCVCAAGFIWLIQWVTRWSPEGASLWLSMMSAELCAVRARLPDHLLFLFTTTSLLTLCLSSGSAYYTESVWHSVSEVFIAAVLFTARREKKNTYKWLGIQFGLLWKCDSGRFKGSQSSPEEARKCLIFRQFVLKHFPVGHKSLSMNQWNPHNIYGRRHNDSSKPERSP